MKSLKMIAVVALGTLTVLAGEPAREVDYKKLGYENELYTWEGKPYTGAAIKKDKQGHLRGRYHYAAGQLDGVTEEWGTNGVKTVETPFVKGRRHGTNTYWNTDGSLLKRQIWNDGQLIDSTDKHDLETK